MATAVKPNTFIFNSESTIGDILVCAKTLERTGHRPSLRFLRYKEEIEGVTVEFDPKEEKPRFEVTPIGRNVLEVQDDGMTPLHDERDLEDDNRSEMAVVDEAPDPATTDPIIQRRTALHDIRWSQVTPDTVVVWEGEQTTWGQLAQNEKMMCEFFADGTLVGGFSI